MGGGADGIERGSHRSAPFRLPIPLRQWRRYMPGPKAIGLGVGATVVVAFMAKAISDNLDLAILGGMLVLALVFGSVAGLSVWHYLTLWRDRPAWKGAPSVFEADDALDAVRRSGHPVIDVVAALKEDLREHARYCARRGPDRIMTFDEVGADGLMGSMARGRFPDFIMRAPAESVLAYADAVRAVLRLLLSTMPYLAWYWYDTGDDAEAPEEILGSDAHIAYWRASALGIAAAFRDPQSCDPRAAEQAAIRVGEEAVAAGVLSRLALEWAFRRSYASEAEEAEALTAAIRLLDHLLALRSPDAVLALRALFRPL